MAGAAKVYYAVNCNVHGKEIGDSKQKLVLVGPPGSKAKRKNSGCPICRKAQKAGQ